MKGIDVFSKIQENNKKIDELFDPTTFVLNKKIMQLKEENARLQDECEHEFEQGRCKYCGRGEL